MQDHKFKDEKGREWSLKLTVSKYLAIREEFGVDFGKVFDKEDNWVAQILAQDDMMLLPLILLELCSKQIEDRKMIDEDFFEGMGGDTLTLAADALIQAVTNFTPVHKRRALQVVVDNLRNGMDKAVQVVVQREQEMGEKMNTHIEERMNQELDSMLNGLYLKPPESAE